MNKCSEWQNAKIVQVIKSPESEQILLSFFHEFAVTMVQTFFLKTNDSNWAIYETYAKRNRWWLNITQTIGLSSQFIFLHVSIFNCWILDGNTMGKQWEMCLHSRRFNATLTAWLHCVHRSSELFYQNERASLIQTHCIELIVQTKPNK